MFARENRRPVHPRSETSGRFACVNLNSVQAPKDFAGVMAVRNEDEYWAYQDLYVGAVGGA